MQICPNRQCKADNDDAASTCAQCGKPLRGLLGRGTVLDNRYRIDDLLGCGGYGAVYCATDGRLNVSVAVKENLAPFSNEQFLTEAQLLASLRHDNLPRVSDCFIEPNGRQYLVGWHGRTERHLLAGRDPLLCPDQTHPAARD